ncbi:rab GTPase-binding effector protein 2 [Periophthalmus magnuspinnatus]|uniref:rab GTPase-binding effector protein 2 n=1 Tax=Periophthalmus magnuspinnatus TaxID=409849 RepID=UPI00145B94AF|nr:rab GTPase-binding effector protein 2 [Periophthalmus magnuspinnatus]
MSSKTEDSGSDLRAQLEECRAQVEHWQGVATICELSKQEELAELQKQCDQEMQSLQEALRETAAQYEARIAFLQSQQSDSQRACGHSLSSGKKGKKDPESPASTNKPRSDSDLQGTPERAGLAQDSEEGALVCTDSFFSLRNCDSASLSSFSMDTPSLPRKPNAQDDTDSLVSTGTLVPEAIYLPPAGHRLVSHSDWESLHAQLSDLRAEVSRLESEKENLEKELDTQTNQTHKQVSKLQSQVKTSEALLKDLHKSFSQSQNAVQSRLAELSLSQKRMHSELSRLRGEEVEEEEQQTTLEASALIPATLQGAHCEERLRIEIVNLKELLDARTEENEVLEVQFSSLKTETERIQALKDQLQADLLVCRNELGALRVALSHVQSTNKSLTADKTSLQQQCLELRSQVISLRSQVDTSQTVQRDFVQLSQSLQVKLELIRQAETLEQVRGIVEDAMSEDLATPTEAT